MGAKRCLNRIFKTCQMHRHLLINNLGSPRNGDWEPCGRARIPAMHVERTQIHRVVELRRVSEQRLDGVTECGLWISGHRARRTHTKVLIRVEDGFVNTRHWIRHGSLLHVLRKWPTTYMHTAEPDTGGHKVYLNFNPAPCKTSFDSCLFALLYFFRISS